jgi:DNA-binding beta-propeller fold protein YncE
MDRVSKYIILLLIVLSFILNSCLREVKQGNSELKRIGFAYDLSSPDSVYYLDDDLLEISGISWYGDNKIACIQDEQGIIYIFDTSKGRVTGSYKFGKNDDYEDIAVSNDTVWILSSKGIIYKVTELANEKRKVTSHSTLLSVINNPEGLAYDLSDNNLLIACKNQSSVKGQEKLAGFKAIYRFRTTDNNLLENPEFLIDLEQFNDYKETRYFKKVTLRLAKKLNLVDNAGFQPSGLAIHPFNDEIYVISATPGMLAVIDRSGDVRNILPLDKHIFRQPEGICFSPDGDLYISNEGKNGRGNILKFNYIPK